MKDTFVVSCTENTAMVKCHRLMFAVPGFVNLVAFVPPSSDWAKAEPGKAYVLALLREAAPNCLGIERPALNPTLSPDPDQPPATKRTGER